MPQTVRDFVDGLFGQVHIRISKPEGAPTHPPLICLHQSPKSSREFARFLPLASADRIVVGIDSPGHGESDLPPSEAEATIENYARSAWTIIDALGFETVDLLGHHTGAKVATEMAYQRGDNVRKIVMISALVLTPEEQADFADQFSPIAIDEAGTRFSEMWKKAVHYKGKDMTLEMLADSFAENLRAGDAYEWGHQAAFAYNRYFADRVATLPHDITVLNPGDMLFELTPRVAPLLQNGRVIDYPDWGFGFLEATPEDAVEAIRAALKD